MRRLFTLVEARAAGITKSAVRWGEGRGRWRRAAHGVYADGPDPVCALDLARAKVIASRSVARGRLAGVLHDFDGVKLGKQTSRFGTLPPDAVITIGGIPCTDPTQTLIDLAAVLNDNVWEQALESALRRKLVTAAALDARLPELSRARTPGAERIRRVLARRGRGVPATGSLLETLMVQLARLVAGLGDPVRQLRIENRHGGFVAFVDLCWPELGIFIELDGQQHKGQPVYDAIRQTAVSAATGWLCGRFTWHEVVHLSAHVVRRLADLAEQGRARPVAG